MHKPAAADAAPSATNPSPLLTRALQARGVRTTMAALLPAELFVDPAWDMMIELLIAAETRQVLCVKDLILLSGERSTTALRRIDRLQNAELIARETDPVDHRRVQVALTPRGHSAMAAMLEKLFVSGAEAASDPPPPPRSFRTAPMDR